MNWTPDRRRRIGWGVVLAGCFAVSAVLSLHVERVKSDVRRADRQLAALAREKRYLEIEFETSASQHQLATINQFYFGYGAPAQGQYLESERQLAAFGKPAAPDAPRPIRMASADEGDAPGAGLPAMVSPLTGRLIGQAQAAEPMRDTPAPLTSAGLGAMLSGRDARHARGQQP